MSSRLKNYLSDAYKSPRNFSLPKKYLTSTELQIDDQDDGDSLSDFCNIFCCIRPKDCVTLELKGRFPVTREMADLVEIYNGFVDPSSGKLAVTLSLDQIEVIRDLSDKVRKTSFMGDQVHNPSWLSVSARTISSLYRFLRIMKEYRQSVRFG